MSTPLYFAGPVPATCNTCGTKIRTRFYDAATIRGPWAFMCPTCFVLGPGRGLLGPGKGQEFTKQSDGRWLKTA